MNEPNQKPVEVVQAELGPCPKCASDDILHYASAIGWRIVECQSCGINLVRSTEAAALADWNTRINSAPRLSGDLGELVKELRLHSCHSLPLAGIYKACARSADAIEHFAAQVARMREALRNASGFLDNPIMRRRYVNDDLYTPVVESIRQAISNEEERK
jgi:Zn ribbon nucleic-acid-binding protein